MLALVDFANVPVAIRRRGVGYLADLVVRRIDPLVLSADNRLDLRLYDGWYEENKFTRDAQALSAEAQASFPSVLEIATRGEALKVTVTVELACSLAARPNKHLFATYRPRLAPTSIQCRNPRDLGCKDDKCPMLLVHTFFKTVRCPARGCTKTFDDFLHKGEQKLVDTMLTCDLLHHSERGAQHIAVVSSDDDFWPGMIVALTRGTSITHIRTQRRRNDPRYYAVDFAQNYRDIYL